MESPGQAGRHSIIFSAAIYLTASGDGGQQRKEQKKQREVGRETKAAQNARKLKPVCRLMAKAVPGHTSFPKFRHVLVRTCMKDR